MFRSTYSLFRRWKSFLLACAGVILGQSLAQAQNAAEEGNVPAQPSTTAAVKQIYQGMVDFVSSIPVHWSLTALLMFVGAYLIGWLVFYGFFKRGRYAPRAARYGAIACVWIATLLWAFFLVPAIWKIAPPLWVWIVGLLTLLALSFAISRNNSPVRN